MTLPLTVLARTWPLELLSIDPLTVLRSASPPSALAVMPPLTVRPSKRSPAGSFTVKAAVTSKPLGGRSCGRRPACTRWGAIALGAGRPRRW